MKVSASAVVGASLVALGVAIAGSAFAADLSPQEKRRLDAYVTGHQSVFGDVVPPPRIVYEKRGTGRTCVDDGDGVTCHYRTFKFY